MARALAVSGFVFVFAVAGCSSPAAVRNTTPASTCFWSGPANGTTNNTQYPDTGCTYWYGSFELPPGATLRLAGEFPHARYASFNTYYANPKSEEMGLPADAVTDHDIVPDRGAVNPFADGADRNATERSYTLEIVGDARPPDAERRRNTLYGRPAGGSGIVPPFYEVLYRIYVPDEGRDLQGGVDLPRVELVLPDHTVVRGEQACEAMHAKPMRLLTELSPPSFPYWAYWALVYLGGGGSHPARVPVSWQRFFNLKFNVLSNFLRGTVFEPITRLIDQNAMGGLYSNVDNDYVAASVDRRLGPAADGHNVLVLRGKAPRTPRTATGDARMGSGDVRYWSLCQNESVVTTAVAGCLYDEQVPLDSDGFYTIALSLPEDRPRNATDACGTAWLGWGAGDGAGRPEAGVVILRHMLPAPSFRSTFKYVERPGQETEVLGPYLPVGKYVSREEFEAQGCPISGR